MFLLHAVRSCTVCCFPLVKEGFLFKTVGDRSFEFLDLGLDLVARRLHSRRTS